MKNMTKRITSFAMATIFFGATAMTSFAGTWQQNATGCWYQNDNGTYPVNTWQWIDNKSYYFNENGYMLANTTTPDGFIVDASGAWVVNGQVQAQNTQTAPVTNNEIAAAVARAKAAGAGSYQDKYISGGWKDASDIDFALRAIKDANGMIIAPTSGTVGILTGIYDYPSAGSDQSISLSANPSAGNLQPNWLYNPLGKTMNAPAVICMDKNTYKDIGWIQVTQDLNTGVFSYRMDTCDTSGSWVYNPNPTGSVDYYGRTGQLSGWMYRYADGTYAAGGIAYIYDDSASNTADNKGVNIVTQAYKFNENGFLITNTPHDSTFLDEYGRVCDGTAGPFGNMWYYTK